MAISEFQLALIGAGAVLVAGVWGYNSWQEQRQRKAARQMFDADQQDVLVDDSPVANAPDEPRFDTQSLPESHAGQRVEPSIASVAHDESAAWPETQHDAAEAPAFRVEEADFGSDQFTVPAVSEAAEPGEEMLDPMVEFGIALPSEVDVAALQHSWPNATDSGKRVRWIARHASGGEWIEVPYAANGNNAATNTYVAIQLADRQGAIDKGALGTFCEAAEAASAVHGALIEVPPIDDVFAHASALDEFCAGVDIQIALHLVGGNGQSFAGSKLRGLLEAAGLRLAADGRFYLHDDKGAEVFSVSQSGTQRFDSDQMRTGAIQDVTFWLDVPRVVNGARAFDNMLAIARRLATPLEGMLVDDRRSPLADSAITGIRAKVVELQTQMASNGIPAGGRRALRLFC